MKLFPRNPTDNSQLNYYYDTFFDKGGNFYIKNEEKIYQLIIDSTNNIQFIHDPYFESNNTAMTLGKLKPTSDPYSLKGKIIKDENEQDKDNDNDSDNGEDPNVRQLNQLFPENDDFFENDTDLKELSDGDEDYFTFSSIDGSIIKIVQTDEYDAIYDTLIYDGTLDMAHVLFKSTRIGDPLPYRLMLYTSGYFVFKPIGDSPKVSLLYVSELGPILLPLNNPSNVVKTIEN
jgi:hypothetical protein